MRTKSNRLEELFVRLTGKERGGRMSQTPPNERRRQLGSAGHHRRAARVHRILRIWGQTLVPPAITMTLYFLIFGNLIGARIGEMGGITLHGFHRARPGHDER
jgi:hypothetical protein